MVTFGFELEVSGGATNTLGFLNQWGLTQHSRLHPYHCGCTDCRPTTDGPLFKAQEDCTAAGEFITRILEYGSADADRAITGISRALLLGGGTTSGNVGNHVHVSHEGMDAASKTRLNRLFARYECELFEIAVASHDSMRTYNGRIESPTFCESVWAEPRPLHNTSQLGNRLSWKNPTVEFRLWNSTRAAWRIRTHVGLSVALVEAAKAGVETSKTDPRVLEDVIADYIDAPTWAGILRQRFSKGGFSVAA